MSYNACRALKLGRVEVQRRSRVRSRMMQEMGSSLDARASQVWLKSGH